MGWVRRAGRGVLRRRAGVEGRETAIEEVLQRRAGVEGRGGLGKGARGWEGEGLGAREKAGRGVVCLVEEEGTEMAAGVRGGRC